MRTRKIEKQIRQVLEEENPYLGREGLVYSRVSSKKQETEGRGLQSQESRCISKLHSINVPCSKTFQDSFSGHGDFMERPAMREMLGYIDAHPYKKYVVIFDDLSRFARDVQFHLKLRAIFKARDVLLICLNFNLDDTPEGMFAETIAAASNELDRHKNRRQVIQKMRARLDMGYWPFVAKRGYEMRKDPAHGKLLTPNKDSRALKQALEGFASGNLIRKIDVARFLCDQGFWKKKNGERYIDEVTEILQDVIHCGDIEYPKWGVSRRKGKHRGIISLETFDRIQQRLKKDVTKSRIRVDISSEFPLRGLILCSSCNQKLTGAPCKGRSKKYPYYYCVKKDCSLYGKTLRKEDVEKNFKTTLQRNRLKSEVDEVLQLVFDRVWKEEVQDLKRQEELKERGIRELREKVRGLSELARTARSEIVRKAYESQIEETAIELEREDAVNRIKRNLGVPYRTALAKSKGMLKNPITIWESVDAVEKHRLFFFLFEARLAYTKNEGFRTGNELSTTRIFEEFVTENSDEVDPSGVEPLTSSMRMTRSTS